MELIELLQSTFSPALDRPMTFITDLASERAYIVGLAIVYWTIDATVGIRLGVALMLSYALNFGLKELFMLPRPPAAVVIEMAAGTGVGYGLPSGHTQSTATFWGLLAMTWRYRTLAALAASGVVLVGVSRIYLGLHFPSDVLAGAALGLGVAWLAVRYGPRLRRPALDRWALTLAALALPASALLIGGHLTDFPVVMGALAGYLIAGLWYRHQVWGRPMVRVAQAAFGLAVLFALLLGSSALLPEAFKDNPFGNYARYLALTLVALIGVPWLNLRLMRGVTQEMPGRSA